MAFLEDIALQARRSPLRAWPEVAEDHDGEQQDSEIGQQGEAGHLYQGVHDSSVTTAGTPDGATVRPRIAPSVFSPLTALGMHGRAVGGSARSTREREGGVVTGTVCSGRLSPAGLHDARGGEHEKRQAPTWLWYMVKSLAVSTVLVAAVMLVMSQGKVSTTDCRLLL